MKSYRMKEQSKYRNRGYLPHLGRETAQFITFSLADALPYKVLRKLAPDSSEDEPQYEKLQRDLDKNYGCCILARADIATIVEHEFLSGTETLYNLLDWVIMPNHVHVLINPTKGLPLGDIVKGWKGVSARRINQHLAKTGSVWARDYYDRYIRNEYHMEAVSAYIRCNPSNAGICKLGETWRFSSVWHERTKFERGRPT